MKVFGMKGLWMAVGIGLAAPVVLQAQETAPVHMEPQTPGYAYPDDYWRDRARERRRFMEDRSERLRTAMERRRELSMRWHPPFAPSTEELLNYLEETRNWNRHNRETWRRWRNPYGAWLDDMARAHSAYADRLWEERRAYHDMLISHPLPSTPFYSW